MINIASYLVQSAHTVAVAVLPTIFFWLNLELISEWKVVLLKLFTEGEMLKQWMLYRCCLRKLQCLWQERIKQLRLCLQRSRSCS